MKKFIAFAIATAMGVTMLASTLLAEGEKTEKTTKPQPVVGKVEVVKDGDAITEIKIVGKKETVSVALDDKGKELAAMEGKEVMIKGEKDADGKIVVAEFKEKVAGEPKKGKKEKKEKEEKAE